MNDALAPVLITGATGNVGREVVAALQRLGLPCVAAGIRPAGIKVRLGANIETRALDLSEPRTYDEAVRGMRGLFLLRPPAISDVARTLNVLCDRAIAAGVAHITFLSVDGAERQSWVPHHAVEQHLSACGVSATLLRAGFFAQNLGDAYRRDIREDDRLYVPAGNGRRQARGEDCRCKHIGAAPGGAPSNKSGPPPSPPLHGFAGSGELALF